MDKAILPFEKPWGVCRCKLFALLLIRCILLLYQLPTFINTAMAIKASKENQIICDCPKGTIIIAASNGPKALPVFPPTWKIDCASPRLSPAAIWATFDASG